MYDTGRICSILKGIDYQRVDQPEDADLLLINSCSVRDKAEHKALSELGKFRLLKEKRENVLIGFGGCVAQHVGQKLVKRNPFLDFAFGTQSIHLLPEIIQTVSATGHRQAFVEISEDMVIEELLPHNPETSGVSAFVSIMRGCNNYCSYCIVPYVRGPEISRQPENIIKEIENLIRRGVKEVTLLGQNVNSYGNGSAGARSFADLLGQVQNIPGLARVRFTTSHPKDFGKEIIEAIVRHPKVCRHLHLPVQSGSNRILKMMKRGYRVEQYEEKIALLRDRIPNIALSSDIIVGFPGETEDDFRQTLDLIRRIQYDSLFSFRYSIRQGTKAAELDDDVPEAEKLHRLALVQKMQKEISRGKSEELIGSLMDVLVTGTSRTDSARLSGRSSTNRIVNFVGNGYRPGELVKVQIDRALENSLSGVAV